MSTHTSNTKTPKRALGRGLSALIPESDFDILSGVARGDIAPEPLLPLNQLGVPETAIALGESTTKSAGAEIRYISIAMIEANPFQPRQVFSEEELEGLASSLREHGILQPVLVRPVGDERFQLIAGERRWRAAQRANIGQIPAIVRSVDDRNALELAIIENVQRHNISSVESAQAYRRLSQEFGLSQEQIAARVGKSRPAIANTMRLLDLPPEAIEALQQGKITEGHGRALLSITEDPSRRAILRRIMRENLTVRDVERLSRRGEEKLALTGDDILNEAQAHLGRKDPDLSRLETSLQRALGTSVSLKSRRRGGQLTINYYSPEELQRIIRKLMPTD